MATKTFELAVLISLINGSMFHGTNQADVDEVVLHVNGEDSSVTDPDTVDKTISYLLKKHPKVKDAAKLMAHTSFIDDARYNKLCDLYRRKHEVAQLEVAVRERATEEQEELEAQTA
jgi:hypothetical protein